MSDDSILSVSDSTSGENILGIDDKGNIVTNVGTGKIVANVGMTSAGHSNLGGWTIGPSLHLPSEEECKRFKKLDEKLASLLPHMSTFEKGYLMFRLTNGCFPSLDDALRYNLENLRNTYDPINPRVLSIYSPNIGLDGLESTVNEIENKIATDAIEKTIKED